MMYEELKEMTEGRSLPLMGNNEDNELVIIEEGAREGEHFFKVTTVQHNNWCRINTYWEDGTREETYKKKPA